MREVNRVISQRSLADQAQVGTIAAAKTMLAHSHKQTQNPGKDQLVQNILNQDC